MAGRSAGADSSSALSPKSRTALWQRLRMLDREISAIDKRCRYDFFFIPKDERPKIEQQRSLLDENRKQVRQQLKALGTPEK